MRTASPITTFNEGATHLYHGTLTLVGMMCGISERKGRERNVAKRKEKNLWFESNSLPTSPIQCGSSFLSLVDQLPHSVTIHDLTQLFSKLLASIQEIFLPGPTMTGRL